MKLVSIALATITLAACREHPPAPATPPALDGDTCRAGAVAELVGRPYTPALERDARERTAAATVRVIRPGDATTMDYQTGRLNLDLDAQGRVAAVRCG